VLPADRALQEMAGKLRDAQRRIERLETLENPSITAGVVCIDRIVLGATADEVEFESIDQSFLHLWLWIYAAGTSNGCPMLMTFNGDAGDNYRHFNVGDERFTSGPDQDVRFGGTSVDTSIKIAKTGGATSGADNFGACEINIMNYGRYLNVSVRRSIVWKSWDYSFVFDESDLSWVGTRHGGGQWTNVSDPITSILISAGGGLCEFASGSIFTLMGVCAI
jgi:hypothetical protein